MAARSIGWLDWLIVAKIGSLFIVVVDLYLTSHDILVDRHSPQYTASKLAFDLPSVY